MIVIVFETASGADDAWVIVADSDAATGRGVEVTPVMIAASSDGGTGTEDLAFDEGGDAIADMEVLVSTPRLSQAAVSPELVLLVS